MSARATLGLLLLIAGAGGCASGSHDERSPPPIVGVWLVRAPEAPFPLHMFAFHADGTVEQSNPDAGDPRTSDSNLMGVWRSNADRVTGKLVEVTADRATHLFVARTEITFTLRVTGDTFSGTAVALSYDAAGQATGALVRATLEGERVVP